MESDASSVNSVNLQKNVLFFADMHFVTFQKKKFENSLARVILIELKCDLCYYRFFFHFKIHLQS